MPTTVLVPAHDEQDVIAAAIESVNAQTHVPERRIVMLDNCTDATESIVLSYPGWEAWKSEGNTHKKAGALNQAWTRLQDDLADEDFLFVMDADSELDPLFMEAAYTKFAEGGYGGVGGVFRGRSGGGFVGMLQRNEYVRYERETRQKKGKVMVLTGTATLFNVAALRAVVRARREGHERIPSGNGLYDTAVLTEDNELSLALRHLGYKIISPRECTLTTEVMETWGDLAKQRLRWKRGAIENCRQYGFTKITLQYWWRQALSLIGILMTIMYFASLGLSLALVGSLNFQPFWLGVTLLFALERVISVRRRGLKMMLLASVLIIEMTFDIFLQAIQARAFWQAIRKSDNAW